jgi:hypothetical protein
MVVLGVILLPERRREMTKSTRKVIEKTLKHYDEMIEWAKGQKPRGWPDRWRMKDEIKQNWFDMSCPLCKAFYSYLSGGCGECPLVSRYGNCTDGSSKNAWLKMYFSTTWKSWIRHATRMREQIESLLEEVKP